MLKIKWIVNRIKDELNDADSYARAYLLNKSEDLELARCYQQIATEELAHANRLHEQATRLIDEYKMPNPPAMQAVWDYEHENMIEHMEHIKHMLGT